MIFLNEAIDALGWQGGTIHQVLDEIKRLKSIATATERLMNQLHFRASVGGIKFNTSDESHLAEVKKAFFPGR